MQAHVAPRRVMGLPQFLVFSRLISASLNFGLAAVSGLREAAAGLSFHVLAKFSICQKIFLDRNEWGEGVV